MQVDNQQIIPIGLVPTTAAAIYTAPSNKSALITKLIFCNPGATDLTLTLAIDTYDDAHTVIKEHTIKATETYECYSLEGEMLILNQKIMAQSSGAGMTVLGTGLIIS